MSTTALLRWTGALWFVPVVFAVGVYVGVRELAFRTGYPVADLAIASYELTLVGPIVATYCAFRFSGFARGLDSLAPTRAGAVAVWGAWWPLILGPPIAAVLALLVATQGSLPNDAVSWQIVGLVFATVLACGCLGMALGRALPIAVAVPLAAAVTFWWLAFPGAGTSILLRNLNSGFVVCCTSSQVPSPVMIRGSALVVGVLAACVFVSWMIPRWARHGRAFSTATLVVVCAAAVVAGAGFVQSSDERPTLQAVAARTTTQTCEELSDVRLCVWPEDESRISVVRKQVADLNRELKAVGLPAVVRAEEDLKGPAGVGFSAHAAMTSADIRYSLTDGYARWQHACRSGERDAEPPAAAVAFVGLASGLSEDDLRNRFDEKALSEASTAIASGNDAARAWFVRELGPDNASCGG